MTFLKDSMQPANICKVLLLDGTAVKSLKFLKYFVESKRNSFKMCENKRIEFAKIEQYNENLGIKKPNIRLQPLDYGKIFAVKLSLRD